MAGERLSRSDTRFIEIKRELTPFFDTQPNVRERYKRLLDVGVPRDVIYSIDCEGPALDVALTVTTKFASSFDVTTIGQLKDAVLSGEKITLLPPPEVPHRETPSLRVKFIRNIMDVLLPNLLCSSQERRMFAEEQLEVDSHFRERMIFAGSPYDAALSIANNLLNSDLVMPEQVNNNLKKLRASALQPRADS